MSLAAPSVYQKAQAAQGELDRICAYVLLVGGIGTSIASLVDSSSGLFTAWDNYGTAITSALYLLSGVMMLLRPHWRVAAIMVSLIPTMIYQQGVMVIAVHAPSAASLYSAMSSGPFWPLLYVAVFITLPRGAAAVSWVHCAGFYVQFALNTTLLADPSPSPDRHQAEHLLIEILMSHPVYIVALSYIVKLRERLYAAHQAVFEHKKSMLAMMSHEIRNQLQTMLGATELLELKLKAPDERRPLVRLQKAATQLQTYLSDFNEMILLENPVPRVEKATFDLASMLADIRDDWLPFAQRKGLDIVLEATEIWVRSDEARLRQVLSNLVSNAVKYTHTGQVTLRARVDAMSSDTVLIEVVDTGIGIDEEHRQRVFLPHVRLSNALECCEDGSGLGLTIAERLVASLGAALELESRPGHGTCFRIVLPALVQLNHGPDEPV